MPGRGIWGGQKGRTEGYTIDVYDENVAAEVVLVNHDACRVRRRFEPEAQSHADQDALGTVGVMSHEDEFNRDEYAFLIPLYMPSLDLLVPTIIKWGR